MRVRAAIKKYSKPFLQFYTFYVNWGKIFILFTNLGENMHSPPPFFSSPFNPFSPKMLFGHILPGGGGQAEKNTPLGFNEYPI